MFQRFSAFRVGDTNVCGVQVTQDKDGGDHARLDVECADDAHRIVHLRQLWASFPPLGECQFDMTPVS